MWSGLLDSRVLPARAEMPLDGAARLLDARADGVRILIGSDREHLLVQHGDTLIRIDVVEGTVRNGPVTLRFDLADDARLEDRIAAIRSFRAAPTPGPRHERLANKLLALQAVDMRKAGASLRKTADLLFGPGDWPGGGDHRKSRVRRLCDLGTSLIEAGPAAILSERTS